jgi:hypothetical protein
MSCFIARSSNFAHPAIDTGILQNARDDFTGEKPPFQV